MRIIGGTHKGRHILPPKNLPVRPTTGFAFEGLFNILNNRIDFEGIKALDLFSGTGHISYELASRGAASVIAIDKNGSCLKFIKQVSEQFNMPLWPLKADVFQYLQTCEPGFDFIFADPPYALETIDKIHALVMERHLLLPGGLLVIEHGPKTDLQHLAGFVQLRVYGNVNFSFFEAGK